jgi:hypothetical protein
MSYQGEEMNRRIHVLLVSAAIILVIAGASGSTLGAPRLDSMHASWIVADGINLGCRMRLSDPWRLIFNLDMCHKSAYITSSAVYMHNKPIFVLTAGYVGAGISYEFQAGRFYPNVLAGAEFGAGFAEYEWIPPSKNYGKVRCGLRARF